VSSIGYGFEQTYHPLSDFCKPIATVLVSRSCDRSMERKYHAAIPAVVTGIALGSLPATHVLSLQSSSYASFPLAAGASMVFLVAAERVSDGAAALFDSPVRFSRREELE
jgi:hypothetical protein